MDEKLNALRDELMKKILELEQKDKDQDEEISLVNKLFDRHESTLEDLQDQINQLKSQKCSQDDFDKESHELRLLI